MLPIHILTQNLLCDFSQMGIPFDSVDKEYSMKPRKWDTNSIRSFMMYMGPLSSIFDILCFAVMWWIIGANTQGMSPLFQCGWFVFGTVSQVIVIHMIRTARIPFFQSKPSAPLLSSTILVAAVTVAVGFSGLSAGISMGALPLSFIPWLILILALYCAASQFVKRTYIRRFGEWL
jgi:Mg2+-importing ATPase